MRYRAVIVFALVLLGTYLAMRSLQGESRSLSQLNACRRQVGYLCWMAEKGYVSREDFCTVPIPEIPSLRDHYEYLRWKDGEWYAKKGWLYYPTVKCSEKEIVFSLMEREFVCDGLEAVERPFHQSTQEPWRPESGSR